MAPFSQSQTVRSEPWGAFSILGFWDAQKTPFCVRIQTALFWKMHVLYNWPYVLLAKLLHLQIQVPFYYLTRWNRICIYKQLPSTRTSNIGNVETIFPPPKTSYQKLGEFPDASTASTSGTSPSTSGTSPRDRDVGPRRQQQSQYLEVLHRNRNVAWL